MVVRTFKLKYSSGRTVHGAASTCARDVRARARAPDADAKYGVWRCDADEKEWNGVHAAAAPHTHSRMKPDSLIMPKSIMRINFKNAYYTWQ